MNRNEMNQRRIEMKRERHEQALKQSRELAQLRKRSLAMEIDAANDAARQKRNATAERMLHIVEAVIAGRKADALSLLGAEPPAGPVMQMQLQMQEDRQMMREADARMGEVIGALTKVIEAEIEQKLGMSTRGG
jgi:hypothetical protein